MISQPGSVAASAVDFEIACERTGLDLVTMLVSGDYAGATKSFDTAMKAALPSDRLAEIWAAIVGANGMVVGLDKPVVRRSSHDAQFTIVVPVRFSGAILDATVACDSSGLVAGLHFNAHHASPEPGPVREPDLAARRPPPLRDAARVQHGERLVRAFDAEVRVGVGDRRDLRAAVGGGEQTVGRVVAHRFRPSSAAPAIHKSVAATIATNAATSAIGVPVSPIAPATAQPSTAPNPPQATMAAR